jgi:quercetin dioxygenase-like cupin family protein
VVLSIAGPKARTAEFIPRGSRGGNGTNASRSLIIELKDAPATHYENKTGYPAAFPRPHVEKLLENNRVVVWSYRWTPGEPTPMHFHDKDVVVVYLEPTALVSTTPDGSKTLNEYKVFDIRFNKGDRTHTESLAHGEGSAMMMELK